MCPLKIELYQHPIKKTWSWSVSFGHLPVSAWKHTTWVSWETAQKEAIRIIADSGYKGTVSIDGAIHHFPREP